MTITQTQNLTVRRQLPSGQTLISKWRAFASDRRGVSAVEFAFVLPVLIILLTGIVLRAMVYDFLSQAFVASDNNKTRTPYSPTRNRVTDVIDALKGLANFPADHEAPCWIAVACLLPVWLAMWQKSPADGYSRLRQVTSGYACLAT